MRTDAHLAAIAIERHGSHLADADAGAADRATATPGHR
jgi:hypothetical protein